jgi:uncharacterized membrane protein YfcA
MPDLLLSLVLGFGIGGSLGLLGGGGSILTVPALVYLVGQTPQVAVTTSLAIVGANSALGAFPPLAGTLNWRVALILAAVGWWSRISPRDSQIFADGVDGRVRAADADRRHRAGR